MVKSTSEQIRVRLSPEEMATVRKIAAEKNTTQSQVVIAGIKKLKENEYFFAALAEMETRINQRLAQLPSLVWREVVRQTQNNKQKGNKE